MKEGKVDHSKVCSWCGEVETEEQWKLKLEHLGGRDQIRKNLD